MEIASSEVIRFYTRKMIKKTNFIMSPCKMINLFQDVVTHVGSGLPQGHKKKVSRPSAIFMINRTQYIYI